MASRQGYYKELKLNAGHFEFLESKSYGKLSTQCQTLRLFHYPLCMASAGPGQEGLPTGLPTP